MFSEVWKWAGTRRKTYKNLGVDKSEIPMALRNALDDCRYWIDNKVFEPDEISVRFKYLIVRVHPFANGNGRHSRLMADILISKHFRKPVFSWGGKDLVRDGENRRAYLEALREADGGKFGKLIAFARS
jgi:Fic-DOC domain mobile mystery protein B